MIAGNGLRRRVLVASTAITLVILGALFLLLMQERSSRREVLALNSEVQTQLVSQVAQAHGIALIRHLADALTNDLYYFDLRSIGEQLAATLRQPPMTAALVFDSQGRVVHDGSHDISTYGSSLSLDLVKAALASDEVQVQRDDGVITAALRIRIGDEVLGGVLTRFGLDELNHTVASGNQRLSATLEHASRQRIGSLTLLLAFSTVLALASGWIIQRWIVRPIQRLATVAREIEAGQYGDYQLDSGRRDEIGELERVFERMSQRIAETHRSVARKAYQDKLTGLPNRRAFDEALAEHVARARAEGSRFALMFLDVDNLKQVNDTIGHDAGDRALIRFALLAERSLEQHSGGSAWLARIGGDEFAVLARDEPLPDRALAQAEALMQRVRASSDADQTALGASIGIAVYPTHATDASELLRCADHAMYRAKQLGKNQIQISACTPTP